MSAPALPGFAEHAPLTKDDRTGALCPVCGRRGACRCSARGWDALTIDQALAGIGLEDQDDELEPAPALELLEPVAAQAAHMTRDPETLRAMIDHPRTLETTRDAAALVLAALAPAAGCPGCGSPETAGPGLWCTACVLAHTAERYRAEDGANYRDRRTLARAALARLAAGEPADFLTLYGRAAEAVTSPDPYDIDPHPNETPQMPAGAWRRAVRACTDELAAQAGTTRPLSPELAEGLDRPPATRPVADVPTGTLF